MQVAGPKYSLFELDPFPLSYSANQAVHSFEIGKWVHRTDSEGTDLNAGPRRLRASHQNPTLGKQIKLLACQLIAIWCITAFLNLFSG